MNTSQLSPHIPVWYTGILFLKSILESLQQKTKKGEEGSQGGEKGKRRQCGDNNKPIFIFLCCKHTSTPQFDFSLKFYNCISVLSISLHPIFPFDTTWKLT